jgi:hypothetical protein
MVASREYEGVNDVLATTRESVRRNLSCLDFSLDFLRFFFSLDTHYLYWI